MVVSLGIVLSLIGTTLASPPQLLVGDYLLYRVARRSQKAGTGPVVCEQKMIVTAVSIRNDVLKLKTTEQCGFDAPLKTIARYELAYSRATEINADILKECERYVGGELRTVASPFGNTDVCIVRDSTDDMQVWSTPVVPITGFIQSTGVREDGEINDYYLVEARLYGKTTGPASAH